MEEHANRNSRGCVEELRVNDKVYLSTRNLSATHFKQASKKLQPRFLGPFKVLKKVSKYTFELELPKNMSRLHPVFHVSLLWKDKPSPPEMGERLTGEYTSRSDLGEAQTQQIEEQVQNLQAPAAVSPTTSVDGNGKRYYNVAAVTDRKKVGRSFRWRVKWEGFPDDNDDTWEPKSSFNLGTYADDLRVAHDKQYLVGEPKEKEEVPDQVSLPDDPPKPVGVHPPSTHTSGRGTRRGVDGSSTR